MTIAFRPLASTDLPTLAGWIAAPHVREWWGEPHDLASVEERYLPMIEGTDPTQGFVILSGDDPIGFIQRYRLDDEPEWRECVSVGVEDLHAAGIDFLIGDATKTGCGLGTRAIAAFVGDLWESYPEVTSVAVAVQQLNVPSWRALERCGFRRVWSGQLRWDDPSDRGPAFLYVLDRRSP